MLRLFVSDLAAIRQLLESETGGASCPSCSMPFDKGKKRKLIDTCGHERCFTCMFRNEACPLCANGHTKSSRNTPQGWGNQTPDSRSNGQQSPDSRSIGQQSPDSRSYGTPDSRSLTKVEIHEPSKGYRRGEPCVQSLRETHSPSRLVYVL